jgi:hypothetical protein
MMMANLKDVLVSHQYDRARLMVTNMKFYSFGIPV